MRLYKLAADQGFAKAQYNLGLGYAKGLGGLPKDEHEAVRLITLAAEQGDENGKALLAERGRR